MVKLRHSWTFRTQVKQWKKTPLGAQWYHLVDPKTLRRWLEEFTALASLPTSLFVSNNPLHAEQVAWQSGLAEDFSSRAWDLSGWENHDCPQSSLTFWIVLEFAKENVVERCRKSCFTLVIDAFHVSHLGSFRVFFLPRRAFRGTQVGYVSQYCDLSRCTSLRGINRIARKMSWSQNRGKPVSFTASCGPSHQPLSGFENNVGAWKTGHHRRINTICTQYTHNYIIIHNIHVQVHNAYIQWCTYTSYIYIYASTKYWDGLTALLSEMNTNNIYA